MAHDLPFLLESYREAIVQILGNRLKRIILYGSYARGDFRQDSDLDIMILTDIQPGETGSYSDRIYDVTYDFEVQYGMEINPSIQNIQIYEQWKSVYPFFMNIEKEGVAI